MNDPDGLDTKAVHLDLIRTACFRMADFLVSPVKEVDSAGMRATLAIRRAIAGGVDVEALASALEASPQLVELIYTGKLDLTTLHPAHTE